MPRKKLIRVAILPALFTLGNLLCGVWSINYTIRSQFETAAWFIFLAMVFDALDGKVARATRSTTRFGAQLDSLSDLISFGLAPALLVRWFVRTGGYDVVPAYLFMLLCIFYVVCATLRLARFNIETAFEKEAHNYFTGLPTPGAAGLLAAFVILYYYFGHVYNWFPSKIIAAVLPVAVLVLAILMISQFRYIHLLNRLAQMRHPFARLGETILVLLLFAYQPELVLWVVFLIYATSAPISGFYRRIFRKPRAVGLTTKEKLLAAPNVVISDQDSLVHKNRPAS